MNIAMDCGQDGVSVAYLHIPAVFFDIAIPVESIVELAVLNVNFVGCYSDNRT